MSESKCKRPAMEVKKDSKSGISLFCYMLGTHFIRMYIHTHALNEEERERKRLDMGPHFNYFFKVGV